MDIERTSSSIPEQQQPSSTNKYYIDYIILNSFIKNPYSFVLADGVAPFQVLGTIELLINFAGVTTTIHAHVAQRLCTNIILGMDFHEFVQSNYRHKTSATFYCLQKPSPNRPIRLRLRNRKKFL